MPVRPLRATLCLAGSELVRGERRDRNGAWMAARLEAAGARVGAWFVAPDDEPALAETLRAAAGGSDLLVVSGGLGPTADDRTREALARATGQALSEHPEAWAQVAAALAARGRPADPAQRRQARLPAGARPLPNPVGVAPGVALAWGATQVFLLPGVPAELEAMFEAEVLAWLRARGDAPPAATASLGLAGLVETEVEAALADLAAREGVSVGYYPHAGEVEVRLRAEGAGAAARLARAEAAARAALGAHVYGPPPAGRIEAAVVALLRERGLTVATAESLTAGAVAARIAGVPGASRVLRGGVVAYATALKCDLLGVDPALIARHGVVSEPVACAMAAGVLARTGAGSAVATTGVAGPDPLCEPDRPPVPVGRVCVAAGRAGGAPVARTLVLAGDRAGIRERSVVAALDLLRRLLGSPA